MLLDLLVIGVAIALAPLSLLAYLLALSSKGGVRNGLAFVVGWSATIVVLVVLTVTVTGGKSFGRSTAPATAVLVLTLLAGAGLLYWGWRHRAVSAGPATQPRWMAKVDSMNVWAAMSLGCFIQPWPFVAVGAASVTQANLSNSAAWLALIVYCVLCSSTYIALQVQVTLSPVKTKARLDRWKQWIADHRRQAMAVIAMVLGAWLAGHSAYQLIT